MSQGAQILDVKYDTGKDRFFIADNDDIPAGTIVTAKIDSVSGRVKFPVGTDTLVLGESGTTPQAAFPFLSVRSDNNYTLASVPSPYSPGHVLHPSVLYFKDGKRGYKYWMAYTPYPDSDSTYENPCIAVSDDGISWAWPTGVTNPLFAKPARSGSYNSDTELYWDQAGGQFVLLWRSIGEVANTDVDLWISTSSEGINWAPRTNIWHGEANVSDLASPSIWYNSTSSKWEILGHNVGTGGTGALSKTTSSNLLQGWDSALTALTAVPPTGRKWWHSQFKRIADGSVVGIVQDNNGTVGSSGNLYSAFSPDGVTFSYSLLDAFDAVRWYRPSFVIRDDVVRGEFYVEFFGSKLTTSGIYRKLMRLEKGRDSLPVTSRNTQLVGASLALSPTLIADTFNRTDDATGLGTSTSGHSWTTVAGPTNVLGISGNKCYNVTTGNCKSTRDLGVADYLLRARFDTKSVEMYLMCRYVDSSNYLRIGVTSSSGQLKLERITGGAATTTALGITPANGDEVVVRCCGAQITIWLNETLVTTLFEMQGVTATVVGIQMAGTLGGRLDNFLASSL